MEELLKILQDLKPDIDFQKETALIDKGLLDSFDIVQLVQQLNETFDIEIGAQDIVPENFNSCSGMLSMIKRLED